jgi:XisH protein
MAKDTFYPQVKSALLKTGWIITADPLKLEVGGVKLEVDLAAEKPLEGLIAAERGIEKIAIEVKSFISNSPTHELNAAIGQFIAYRLALEELEPDRKVYLAVPIATYSDFMQRPFPRRMIDVNRVPLMVYDPIQEEILKWL